jgi:CheY-like chemotaxis protein
MKPLALVIESDGGTRRLLDVLLSRLGLEVDLVASGTDALLLLERVEYDLIFTDLRIPGRSGMEILEWMARERPESLERTIALSSGPPLQLDEVRQRWPSARAIRKPFELNEITEAAARASARPPRPPATIPEEFTRRSVRAGAKAGVVLQGGGPHLQAILSFGYTPAQIEAFMPLMIDSPFPICAAARHRRAVWMASLALASNDYPALVPVWKKNESRALAAVPLVRDGELLGVIGWAFREPRLFSEPEQQTFLAIAQVVNDELMHPAEQHQSGGASRA